MEIIGALKSKSAGLIVKVSLDESNIFVASEDYSISIIDRQKFDSGPFLSITDHSNRVTGIKCCDSTSDGHVLYTTSEDGRCNVYDLRKGQTPVQTFNSDRNVGLYSLDLGFSGNVLCCGTDVIKDNEEGDYSQLLFFDIRSRSTLAALNNVHSDIVTSLSFSKYDNRKILSSSMDGLCCVSDISQNNDDDSLETVVNLSDPIEKSGFFGPQDDFVWSISSSYSFSLSKLEDASVLAIHKEEPVATPFKPSFSFYTQDDNSQALYTIGTSQKGDLTIFKADISSFKQISKLENVHETEINELSITTSRKIIYSVSDTALVITRIL